MVTVFFKYTGWFFGLLCDSLVLLHNNSVISENFIKCKFVLRIILSPRSLSTFMTFFFTLSGSGPHKPFNIARLSSLYNPTEWCSQS